MSHKKKIKAIQPKQYYEDPNFPLTHLTNSFLLNNPLPLNPNLRVRLLSPIYGGLTFKISKI